MRVVTRRNPKPALWASAVCVFLISTIALGAEPVISEIQGKVVAGNLVVISGQNFTQKQEPQPVFWWNADEGPTPSSMGRVKNWASTSWSGANVKTQAVVAPGSLYSYATDHGATEGAALGGVYVSAPTGKLYVWRKHYEDFDITVDYGIRTRVNSLVGAAPTPGTRVTDPANGATGIVNRVVGPNAGGVAGRWELFYERLGGTINAIPATMFTYLGTLTWAGGSASNVDGNEWEKVGYLKSFNWKTSRIYAATMETGSHAASAVFSAQTDTRDYRAAIENVSAVYVLGSAWQQRDVTARRWAIDEFVFRDSSAVGLADGYYAMRIGSQVAAFESLTTRSANYPNLHNKVYQGQVSNGARPGASSYWDSVYIDDSWHRVMLSNQKTWAVAADLEIQIPTRWSDQQVEVYVRLGGLDSSKPLYLYIVNSQGVANSDGYPLTTVPRPMPPSPVVVE